MFWKRKGKKKDSEEASPDGAVTTTAQDERDDSETEDTEPGADTSETTEAEASSAETDSGDAEKTDSASDDAETADGEENAEAGESGEGAEEEEEEPARAPIEKVTTSGVFEFDGEEFSVTNNTWIVPADDEGVIVIDPAHDAEAILKAVGDREIYLVACTNGYSPHIRSAVEVADRDEADIALHRRELRSWRKEHGIERKPDLEVEGGGKFEVGDLTIEILAIPGTAAGSVAYYIAELNAVFSGDTLLAGSMGTVGDGYLDYTRQLGSIGEVLLSLPSNTRVLPDRGEETTVEAESKNFDSWVAGD